MGGWGSKTNPNVLTAPSSPAPITTPASTSSSATLLFSTTRNKSILDNSLFLCMLLAPITAVLLSMLICTAIYFIRKRKRKDHQRPQKTSQEQDPVNNVHLAPDENTQVPTCTEGEITYASLIFEQKPPSKSDL